MHEKTQIWSLYRITNKINNKVYIGQAKDYKHRWSDHLRAVRLNKPTQIIHHALIKHGTDNFEFEVIVCSKNQNDANELETLLVKQYNSFAADGYGYNATHGGMNAPKSEEFKQMISEKNSGKHFSPDTQFKKGHQFSEETLLKMSESHQGQVAWNKGLPKEEQSRFGKKHSPETKEKMRQSALKNKDNLKLLQINRKNRIYKKKTQS